MGYFSELDLSIRNYYKKIPIFHCNVCGGRLGIIGFIAPNRFRAVCKDGLCKNYATTVEVTPDRPRHQEVLHRARHQ